MKTQRAFENIPIRGFRLPRSRGFTVLELLLAATLMTLIVFALYSIFDHTQKALHANIAQTDVSEKGRAAMELMSRELEQMAASQLYNGINFQVVSTPNSDVIQDTVDPGTFRTNHLEDIFFFSRFNRDATGIGYRVTTTPGLPMGTLYRYSLSTNVSSLTSNNLVRPFFPYTVTNGLQRIADGVIHMRVIPYDRFGQVQTNLWPNILVTTNVTDGLPYTFTYLGSALPSYVDLELGVLEPAAVAQVQAVGTAAAPGYLRRQIAKVFLLRKRIPIRSANP